MTILQLDARDPTPPYEQIRRRLALLIDAGELAVGQRLPTVRQLASDLRVAPGTVSRAFKELEAAGYVETRRAAGTRVLARKAAAQSAPLAQLATDYARSAIASGADQASAVDAVREAFSMLAQAQPDALPEEHRRGRV